MQENRQEDHELQERIRNRTEETMEERAEGAADSNRLLQQRGESMSDDSDGEPEHDRRRVLDDEDNLEQAEEEQHDERLDSRIRRKLDTILLPFLALLFLLNSLDKTNIGNAETAGFTRDAGLSARDLNISLGVFFAFFVTLQPVGAALGRTFGMRRWVPACMGLWGLCTLLHIWVRRRWQLIVLRIVIASLEAGFYPTTVSYLSLFYTRYEFGVRLGVFYGQTAVAGVLGSVLSWGVFSQFAGDGNNTDEESTQRHNGGWKSWEALFLIEGCMTMVVAAVGFAWLPRSANTAWFFGPREKHWAERRIQLDRDEAMGWKNAGASQQKRDSDLAGSEEVGRDTNDDDSNGEAHDRLLGHDFGATPARPRSETSARSGHSITADAGLSKQDILSAVFNYKIWHLLVCNIFSAIPATAFAVFLPLVMDQLSPSLDLSPAASNLLSAPPFACGAIVLFAFTRWSDRSKQRLVPILWGLGLLLIGLTVTVMVPTEMFAVRYVSLCVLLSGSFIASPLTVTWLTTNTPEPGKRAIVLGINGWGNFAGVCLSFLFTPKDKDSGYIRPFIITLLCVLASFVGFIAFWISILRENKWREDILATWGESEKERENLVGDAPLPHTATMRLQRRLKVDLLAQGLGMEEKRRGDEKVTFLYSY